MPYLRLLPTLPDSNLTRGSWRHFFLLLPSTAMAVTGSAKAGEPANNGTMTMHQRRPFPPGIHVPSLTFFEADGCQDIDWDTQESHLRYLIQAGVQGSKLHHSYPRRMSTESSIFAPKGVKPSGQ